MWARFWQFENVPKVSNCHRNWKWARFCNSKTCPTCPTVIEIGSGHVFAIRKHAQSVQLSSKLEADTFLQFENVPKVSNCHRNWKRARFCNSKTYPKCPTVIEIGSGHVFAIRKRAQSVQLSSKLEAGTFLQFENVPKVSNCHRNWKRARFCNSKTCPKCPTVIEI